MAVAERMCGGSLREAAARCLAEPEPARKVAMTAEAAAALAAGRLAPDPARAPSDTLRPGRPARPRRVAPSALPRRGLGSREGRAAFLHAIAHIEFNAINLAWDAVARFGGMPEAFYSDWAAVAADEARHFDLLSQHLATLGAGYGDFDAHDGLWEAAEKTSHDCLLRMALVPRVLEARGLDVAPQMIERLQAVGDAGGAGILRLILREEVGHVATGTRWFRWLCKQRGLAPEATFLRLVAEHMPGAGKGRLHHEARRRAGFSEAELEALAAGVAEARGGAARD